MMTTADQPSCSPISASLAKTSDLQFGPGDGVFPATFVDFMKLGHDYTRSQWKELSEQMAGGTCWTVVDDDGQPQLCGGFLWLKPCTWVCWLMVHRHLSSDLRLARQCFRRLSRALPKIAPAGELIMSVRGNHAPGMAIARILGFVETASPFDGVRLFKRGAP